MGNGEDPYGVQLRLELLEEAWEVCKDDLQAEISRRRELSGQMDWMAAVVESPQSNPVGAGEQLMEALQRSGAMLIMGGGIEAKLSVDRDAEEKLRREVASTLRREHGLEAHAQVNAVKV